MNHSEHHGHKKVSAPIIQSVSVDNIKSHSSTNITNAKSVREVKLVLGGDMERYVWHINGKAMFQDQLIQIEENDLVRFTIVNDTMMHHPMHLHGHFFRVLNQYGEFSPLKHTVDVAPHTTRTIEFFANEPGQWMLHCHNLYHMKTGMARIVKYSTWEPSSEMKQVAKKDPHLHDHWYFYGRASGFSNMGELFLRTSQTWNQLEARIEARDDDDWDAEGDVFYRRWHNANLNFVLGGTSTHFEKRPVAGIGYLLPMLIESQVLVDDHGEWRIDIEKKFQWTKYWYSEYEYTWRSDDEFDSEFLVSLMYARQWNWAAGFRYTGHSIGVGFDYQF